MEHLPTPSLLWSHLFGSISLRKRFVFFCLGPFNFAPFMNKILGPLGWLIIIHQSEIDIFRMSTAGSHWTFCFLLDFGKKIRTQIYPPKEKPAFFSPLQTSTWTTIRRGGKSGKSSASLPLVDPIIQSPFWEWLHGTWILCGAIYYKSI